MQRKTHILKTHWSVWDALVNDKKRAEYRKNDRDFATGDYLVLKKVDSKGNLMGGVLKFYVTHMVCGGEFGIPDGFCMLSIQPYNVFETDFCT